jgi:hypothetical protein
VSEGTGRICGGTTRDSGTLPAWNPWKQHGSRGLYLDVDTSDCHFDSIPNYVTTVVGDKDHWQLTGVNSIYTATAKKFRMYVWHPSLYSRNLLLIAKRYKWDVNWIVDSGRRSGVTTSGHTGWTSLSQDIVYVDVDTMNSRYPVTPRYVTAVNGERDHWRVRGAHIIYNPESDGFRVYLVYPAITPEAAEKKKWTISWIGSYSDKYSGTSTDVWQDYKGKTGTVSALYMDVDTGKNKFHGVPSYITSVVGRSHHWGVSGGASIYSPTKTGFRVYLEKAQSAYFAKEKKWCINYIAYQGNKICFRAE